MIIKPPYGDRARKGPGLSAREMAVKAAIEAGASRYIELTCGHFITVETKERYAFCAIKSQFGSVQIYCENCDDFYYHVPPKARPIEDIPQTPLF